MIDIEVLATGSKGNCYLLTSGDTRILLDCGLAYKKTLKLLDFKLPTAVLVTHEHKDHAQAAKDFLNHGVDVFMTKGTADALKLEENHRLHFLYNHCETSIATKNFSVLAIPVNHDAKAPVNFFIRGEGERIFYITDCGQFDYKFEPNFAPTAPTKILIETNYDHIDLFYSEIETEQKVRIVKNHLALVDAKEFLESTDLSECKEIYLIHISERHGDGETFRKVIQEIVGDKVKVIVAKNKEEI